MIWHPDKNSAHKRPESEPKFKKISEAYDPQKRLIYDRYGEDALKSGFVPPPNSNPSTNRAPNFNFNTTGRPAPNLNNTARAANYNNTGGRAPNLYQVRQDGQEYKSWFGFKPRDADEIYAEQSRDIFGRSTKAENSAGGGFSRKAPDSEYKLSCTLEELYKGGSKKMRAVRTAVDPSRFGRIRDVAEILTIDIEPGWKKLGTKVTFPQMGNQEHGATTGDLSFVNVEEKPHTIFSRDGDDLLVHQEISLLESLTGKTLYMKMLDGRCIQVQVAEIIRPD